MTLLPGGLTIAACRCVCLHGTKPVISALRGVSSMPLIIVVVLSALFLPVGCLSPPALHRAVLAYDDTVQRVGSEQLLLNILRARHYQQIHFTKVSSVAATFDFRMTAGIMPPEGDARGLIGPVFNATVAENPTVTIIPIDGEDFTTRLLTPLDEMALRIVAGNPYSGRGPLAGRAQ